MCYLAIWASSHFTNNSRHSLFLDGFPARFEELCPSWFNPNVDEPSPQSYYRSDQNHVYISSINPASVGRECEGAGCQSEGQAPTALCSCDQKKYMCRRCYLWHLASPTWKSVELAKCIEKAKRELQEVNEYLEYLEKVTNGNRAT